MSEFGDVSDFVSYVQSVNISVLIEVASTALFLYEYLLTLPLEINKIWRRKTSLVTLLFLLNRYVVMLNRGLRLIQAVSWYNQYEDVADKMLIVAVFASIRMFALWNRSWIVPAVVFVLGMIYPVGDSIYITTLVFSSIPPPLTGCGQYSTINFQIWNMSSDEFLLYSFIVGCVASAVTECVVASLTWAKTVNLQKRLHNSDTVRGKKGPTYLLLRQGTMHFFIMMTLQILSLMSIPFDSLNNMPAIIDTFLLSLRDDYTSSQASEVQSSRYAADHQTISHSGQLIGNLGASLRLSGDDEDEAVYMETYDNQMFIQHCVWRMKGTTELGAQER
ncbi:hypothetical protein BC629DRAFT_1596611 [Irpex lacteus]|nr:hypothetical protein BC629DRAFT_1596611 [Irpex lacteus]